MALKFNTMLLVYGENVSFEYGGNEDEETYSARSQVSNGVANDYSKEELLGFGVTEEDLAMTDAPTSEELDRLEPIYLSYFQQWNSVRNYQFAKSRGFQDLTHEWDRTHHAENFDQIRSEEHTSELQSPS